MTSTLGDDAAVCVACKAVNAATAKFCNQCGARLEAGAADNSGAPPRGYTPPHLAEKILRSRAAIVGERKRVTVLFADIKGSTQLAETAGAEAWHAILDRYFGLLGSVVHRFEGTINQYTGDGIMALFGAPLALEDHAQRACMAALEAQRSVRAYADELRLASGLNLSMRVGLNSGEVIVGRIGDDLRMDYTAQGLTVHLAARMEHICEPGRIYCTHATAAQAEGYFRLRDLGDTAVDGASAPVRVYELEGEGATTSRLARGLARGETPFIGRETEFAELLAAFDEVAGGSGQIVAVVGEAGIGKSRLCHEFLRECERRGVPLHRATGVPYAAALPLLPIRALTRSRLGLGEAAGAAEARRVAAGGLLLFDPQAGDLLAPLLDFLGVGAGVASDAATDLQKLLLFLAHFLPRPETHAAPQVLLIEDLHFADPGTEACLAELTRQIAATPTLLLLNFRAGFTPAYLESVPHRRILIKALDDAALDRLVQELIGRHDPDCALTAELRRRAAGNPFFVEEAVQALVDSGHLAGRRGAYEVVLPISEWPIAETVHALLAARIDRLDEPLKILLQAAAVIGQGFSVAALVRLSGLDVATCSERLQQLADADFLIAQSGGEDDYRFAHPLLQDTAYHTQLETRRSAAHRQLAEYLEREHSLEGVPTAASVRIAHHWRRTGEWARAGAWNLHAARWGLQRDARTGAQQQRLALTHLARAAASADVDHLRVAAHAGMIRLAQFSEVSADEVESNYRDGRALAESRGDVAGLSEVMISYSAEQLRRGDARQAVDLAVAALETAAAAGVARQLIGRFRVPLLLIASGAGYPQEGIRMINRAGGTEWLDTPIGADNYLSRGVYGYMLGWLGRLDEAAAQVGAAIGYAEHIGGSASWMYANQVELAWLSGEHTGVLARARLALQRAESFGSPFFRAIALRALGSAHLQEEQAAAAVPLLEQARVLVARGSMVHQFETITLATLARAYLGAGDLVRAHANAEAAIASAQNSYSQVWEIVAWLAWLELPTEGRWTARAAEGLERVGQLLARTGAEGLRPRWWLARAHWSVLPAAASEARAQAQAAFAHIGAHAHARRLAAQVG